MLDLLSIGAVKINTHIVLPEANVMCELKKPECKLCIEYGKKIPVAAFNTQVAGSAPNVAVGVAKFACKTSIISYMGDDPAYQQAIAFLKLHQVDTKQIKKVKGFHSSAAVVMSYQGESTQLVDHVPHEYHIPAKMPPCKYLHISELGGKYEHLYRDAIRASKQGVKVSFNPGTYQIQEQKPVLFDLIAASEVLFVNTAEARLLIHDDEATPKHALMKLKALGPRYVVVTDGPHGAYAFDGTQLDSVPAFPGKLVEATGAGDAFSSGFLGALLKGKPHSEALRYGSVNAASVIGAVGPTAGLLTVTEIARRLKAHPGFKTKELS